MRLNRYLALAGLGSRRSTEALIREGRVLLNGSICTQLATDISETDQLRVDGRLIHPAPAAYLLLNKPIGYEVTRRSIGGKRTVYDLLPRRFHHVAHVGRLDVDSEGLLLLTNDGELAQRISHPRYKLEKEYLVRLDRPFDLADTARVLRGIYLAEGRARFEKIWLRGDNSVGVVITQGINRQIRRVFAALDYKVRDLARVRIGPLTRLALKSGEFRTLKPAEVSLLKSLASSKVSKSPPSRRSTGRGNESRSGAQMKRTFHKIRARSVR
jgi:23S rRNA pseudouridine2605 synthase